MTDLPPNYYEVEHLVLLESGKLLLINLLALVPLAAASIWMSIWWGIVTRLRPPQPVGFGADVPWWVWILVVLIISIPVHEGLHGLAIRWAGYKPRYGVMWRKAAFYATADNALFPRNAFIVTALAPIVGITLMGMMMVFLLPEVAGYYIALGVVLNAANSIGDLWMTVVVMRYPPDALVRDEADSIRIYIKA
ncbi:MAG: DUF3267 domain-containing protein [Anaerolineae bacterium]|nr:DUF3267 domain-containing protein [Anaerolineae bacterium]